MALSRKIMFNGIDLSQMVSAATITLNPAQPPFTSFYGQTIDGFGYTCSEPKKIADNPHKPGTPEHRVWEQENIHYRRSTQEYAEAYRVADGRLAALKASRAHVDTTVDDLLDEIAHVDEPEFGSAFNAVVQMRFTLGASFRFEVTKYNAALAALVPTLAQTDAAWRTLLNVMALPEKRIEGRRLIARQRHRRHA